MSTRYRWIAAMLALSALTASPMQSVSHDDLSTFGLFDAASALRDLVPALR